MRQHARSQSAPEGPYLTRRSLITAATLAGVSLAATACSPARSSGGLWVPGQTTPPAPTPTPSRTNPSSNLADVLDLRRLPNGPVRSRLWRYEDNPAVPGYNKEAQAYDDQHATVRDGVLTISAEKLSDGSYRSSRIDTRDSWNFMHGRVTAVAKLPKGAGTWPALWFLADQRDTPAILARHGIHGAAANPADPFYYAWGGEIDALETVGWENNPVNNTITLHTHSSITAGKDAGISSRIVPNPTGEDDFHEYTMWKRKGIIEFGLDGRVVHGVERQQGDTIAEWPFDDWRYYILANLALGGTWAGHDRQQFPPDGIDDSKAPWQFQISELHFQPA